MQAIISKDIPATNTRGHRIKVTCARGSIITSQPIELEGEAAHVAVVARLISRFVADDFREYHTPANGNPWTRARVVGQLPDGRYAHVFVS